MCGITGIVGKSRAVPANIFRDMRDSLTHRGPDDAGVWESSNGDVLLASRRLAILDLSPAGHQPMVDEESGLVIVFNGEIYNYLELAEELRKKGCRFRSGCDTEVLLKSYEIWGTDCVSRFNGMFAFAIWDERERILFAARDRFGEKPFYFYQDNTRHFFAFSSEIKALVAGRIFTPRPNQSAVYGYLENREIDFGSETLFEGIYAIQPAHALVYSREAETLRTWRYWDLDPESELRLVDDKHYAETFCELLTDSVRIRLRSDVPVGSSLSGGIDSSTIVGLIARQGGAAKQETFSARFSDPKYDEGEFIEAMAQWAQVKNHSVYPDPARLLEEIETVTWHQDEPFYSSSVYAQWNVMRLASQCGVTVLLDGQGGDEVLAGYHHFFAGYYLQSLKRLQLRSFVSSVLQYVKEQGTAPLLLIFAAMMPARVLLFTKDRLRPRGIRKEFRRRWGRLPRPVKRKYRNELQQSLYSALTQTVLPQLLRHADRNSMAFSREIRLPFLDHRLVELLFAIPADQKIRSSRTKVVLRNAIRGLVPEPIRLRTDKLGFAPPEVRWLQGPMRLWVEEILSSTEFRSREWWEAEIVDAVWRRFLQGEDSLHTSIWAWISLEVWARTCFHPKTISAASSNSTVAVR